MPSVLPRDGPSSDEDSDEAAPHGGSKTSEALHSVGSPAHGQRSRGRRSARTVRTGRTGSRRGGGSAGQPRSSTHAWRFCRLAVATLSTLLGLLQLLVPRLWLQPSASPPGEVFPWILHKSLPGAAPSGIDSNALLTRQDGRHVSSRAAAAEAAFVASAAAAQAAAAAAVAVAAMAADDRNPVPVPSHGQRDLTKKASIGNDAQTWEPVSESTTSPARRENAATAVDVAAKRVGLEFAADASPLREKAAASSPANSAAVAGVSTWNTKLGAGAVEGPPPVLNSSHQHLFPLVQKLRVEGDCCTSLDSAVRVHVDVKDMSGRLLVDAAARTEKSLRHLQSRNSYSGTSQQRRIASIRVTVKDTSEKLNEDADWSYRFTCDGSQPLRCELEATGVFGAVAAMESTLLQLFAHGGVASFHKIWIEDWPDYRIRGLMLDTGRRFIPKAVLKEVIDGMALVKMNFLQLHLNDFCRFAVALPSFPELNDRKGVHAGQYSLADVQEVVAYAYARGVRIVPEVDLPGHAGGLLPLRAHGMEFCEPEPGKRTRPEQAAKVFDDPLGRTRQVLADLIAQTAEAFGSTERWFHVGGDEASPTGRCSQHNIVSLEKYITGDLLHRRLDRTPLGWEELRFKWPDSAGVQAAGGTSETIVVAWQRATVRGIVQRGHRAIAANLHQHYLDYSYQQSPVQRFWYNISEKKAWDAPSCLNPTWTLHVGRYLGGISDPGFAATSLEAAQKRCTELTFRCSGVTCKKEDTAVCTPREGDPFLKASSKENSWVKTCSGDDSPELRETLRKQLLGGMSAMWTDRYCYIYQCGAADAIWGKKTGTLPTASLMYPPEYDVSFGLSLAGMIWPRAAVGAAALWKYDPEVDSSAVQRHAAWVSEVLRGIGGVASCPPGCACDELSACKQPYPVVWRGGDISESDRSLREACYSQDTAVLLGRIMEKEQRQPLNFAMRKCFWYADACAGVSCIGGDEESCELHAPGRPTSGSDAFRPAYVKLLTERCSPYLAWRDATTASPASAPGAFQQAGLGQQAAGPGQRCEWRRVPQKFLGGYSGKAQALSLDDARSHCIAQGTRCKGVTCSGLPEGGIAEGSCTARQGVPFLEDTPAGSFEVSEVKQPVTCNA